MGRLFKDDKPPGQAVIHHSPLNSIWKESNSTPQQTSANLTLHHIKNKKNMLKAQTGVHLCTSDVDLLMGLRRSESCFQNQATSNKKLRLGHPSTRPALSSKLFVPSESTFNYSSFSSSSDSLVCLAQPQISEYPTCLALVHNQLCLIIPIAKGLMSKTDLCLSHRLLHNKFVVKLFHTTC